jgi:hypothetical protein
MNIGIGGHQDLGRPETFEFLTTSFRQLLQESQPTCVYSALAKGTDQLLMQVALELHVPVEVVIPCKDYESNYVGAEREDYQRLYHAACAHHRLAFPECRLQLRSDTHVWALPGGAMEIGETIAQTAVRGCCELMKHEPSKEQTDEA